MHNPQGFTKRIVSSPENMVLWEIFCKPHASAVSEPVKPRPRAKQSLPLEDNSKRIDDFFPVVVSMPASHSTATVAATTTATTTSKKDDAEWRPTKYRPRFSDADVTAAGPKSTSLSMEHMKNFNASSSDVWDNVAHVHSRRHKQTNERHNVLARTSSQDSFITDHHHQQQQHSSRSAAFPILSMAEWPGQSEGEAMDMDHFWKLVSEYYPEDHPREWLDYRMTDILQGVLPTVGPSSSSSSIQGQGEEVGAVSSAARRAIKPFVKTAAAAADDEHHWRVIPGLGCAKDKPEVATLL
jgi:hypothetical protein